MNNWLGRLFSGKKSSTQVAAQTPLASPDALTDSIAHRRRGNELLDRGDLQSAIACYQKAVASDPDSVDAHTSLGYALKEVGEFAAARTALQRAVELQPDSFDPVYLLAQTYRDLHLHEKAAICFEKAIALQPEFESLYGELCQALFEIKSMGKAREIIRSGIRRYPENASFHFFLGNLYSFMEEWQEATTAYKSALRLNPNLSQAHSNLASAFRAQGDLVTAMQHAEIALKLDPSSPDAHVCMAANQEANGNLKLALAGYESALGLDAAHATSHLGKGKVLLKSREFEAATESLKKALIFDPDSAEACRDLGFVYLELGRFPEAEEYSRKALSLRPMYPSAQNNLGNALKMMGKLVEAEQYYKAALSIDPNSDVYLSNLGGVLLAQGRLVEALASFRRAIALDSQLMTGDAHSCYSNLLFALSHSEQLDEKELFFEHSRFSEKFEAPLQSARPKHTNTREPDRKLRVGFVSGDLYSHVVAQFIRPVLAHLSSDPGLSLHAYYNNPREDSETELLKSYFECWCPVVGLSDAEMAKQIGDDAIDILIDLSGHTGLNRMLTFARKAAPVQASWLGYPGSTGLRAMDYYLADKFVLPVGEFDDQFTEKIVHLPALAPFRPNDLAPPVSALPALANGFVTFGSFNRASKINRAVVACWAELLRAVPTARMLIEGVPEDGQCMEWLEQEGITRERLSWHGRNGVKAYHELHHQVDICLDTFPYNGATTSWCAIWMGVPTLTVVGRTPAARYGAAIMGQMGLSTFVAQDKQDFVAKGSYWAEHQSELADLRSGMRARFGQSTAGQADLIAGALANALRTMWQRWCKGLPAESFVASAVSGTDRRSGRDPSESH